MKKKICKKCLIEKDVCEFHKNSNSRDGLRSKCKECISFYFKYEISQDALKSKKERNKIYREQNKESIKSYIKKYYDENPEKFEDRRLYLVKYRKKNLEYYRTYHKKRNETDSNYKLIKVLRSRLNKIIKNKNIIKGESTIFVLGCTLSEFKIYIESKFTDGMSWENYGYYGWHIDHIIPISKGKTEEEIYKLCHFTNLQPLWAKDNLTKGNRINF
jgi:hypothetical protein